MVFWKLPGDKGWQRGQQCLTLLCHVGGAQGREGRDQVSDASAISKKTREQFTHANGSCDSKDKVISGLEPRGLAGLGSHLLLSQIFLPSSCLA